MKRVFRKLLSGFANPTSRRTPALRDRKARLSLESLEDRRLMTAAIPYLNPGAPIIPHVQIETVYYGSAWSGQASNPALSAQLTAEAQDLNQFFGTITNSPYMDGLAEYTMTNPNGTLTAPGRGGFVRADFVPGQPDPRVVVTNAGLESVLSNEINQGRLDAPNGNTLYVVFMPPGVMQAGDEGSGGGHHWSFSYGGTPAYYATLEQETTVDPTKGRTMSPMGSLGSETPFQRLTEIASHELAEAVTDPMVNVPGKAAYVSTNSSIGEVGDMAQNTPPATGVMGLEGPGYGYAYVVQRYWSDVNNNALTGGVVDFQSIQALSTLANMSFSMVDQNGHSFDASWGDLTSVNSYDTVAQFSGLFDGQAAKVLIQTTGGQKLSVTITLAADNTTVLFVGTLTQPSANWANETGGGQNIAPNYAELFGTVTEGGQSASAFGTGGAIYPPQYTGAGYGGSYGGMGTSPGDNYNNPLRFHRPNYM
jgi:hypothetical protein